MFVLWWFYGVHFPCLCKNDCFLLPRLECKKIASTWFSVLRLLLLGSSLQAVRKPMEGPCVGVLADSPSWCHSTASINHRTGEWESHPMTSVSTLCASNCLRDPDGKSEPSPHSELLKIIINDGGCFTLLNFCWSAMQLEITETVWYLNFY